ncbi:MAG: DPP IV N-terminal domain-containing protein [Aggregatilineales bacterium]
MSANGELEQKLRDGIAAVQSGDKAKARRLLEQVVQQDSRNELGWMWLASCVNTSTERRECLERVLAINPNNTRAQEALAQLGGGRVAPRKRDESADTVDRVSRAQRRRSTTNVPDAPDDGGFRPLNLLLGLLAAVVVVGILLAIAAINQNNNNNNVIPTANVAAIRTVPPRQSTRPIVIVTLGGTRNAPTLPPTFTATASPTPTTTPTPTITPLPVSEFVYYYVSRNIGDITPSLYQINADGSNEQRIGTDMRDIAIDPGGQRIAFIRDVVYEGEAPLPEEEPDTVDAEATPDPDAPEVTEETVIDALVVPELFIAELNNLENAVQITQLRTRIVASPAWSPEGQELVFVSDADGDEDIYYITPDGNNLRLITDNDIADREPAWSPVIGSREVVITSELDSPIQPELYKIQIAEPGAELDYIQLTDSSNSSFSATWSPDGQSIVFVSDRRNDGDIYIMNADGTNETLLTEGDGDAEDRNPTFTPDQRFVVFSSNRDGENFQTFMLSRDGRTLVRLTDSDRNDIGGVFLPDRRAAFG